MSKLFVERASAGHERLVGGSFFDRALVRAGEIQANLGKRTTFESAWKLFPHLPFSRVEIRFRKIDHSDRRIPTKTEAEIGTIRGETFESWGKIETDGKDVKSSWRTILHAFNTPPSVEARPEEEAQRREDMLRFMKIPQISFRLTREQREGGNLMSTGALAEFFALCKKWMFPEWPSDAPSSTYPFRPSLERPPKHYFVATRSALDVHTITHETNDLQLDGSTYSVTTVSGPDTNPFEVAITRTGQGEVITLNTGFRLPALETERWIYTADMGNGTHYSIGEVAEDVLENLSPKRRGEAVWLNREASQIKYRDIRGYLPGATADQAAAGIQVLDKLLEPIRPIPLFWKVPRS